MTQDIEIVEKPDICSIKDCGKLSQFRAYGTMWHPSTPKHKRDKTNCAHIDIGLAVCNRHIEHLRQENLMTDDLWATIIQPFIASGITPPDRSSLIITIKPLTAKPKESLS